MKLYVCLFVLSTSVFCRSAPVPPEPKHDPNGKAVLGIHSAANARVNSFYPVSPFRKAGGEVGDVITKIGSENVKSLATLVAATKKYRPGAIVQVEILRGKEKIILTVTLGESP